MSDIFLNSAIAILTLVTAVWLLSLVLRNSGIMDIFWGLGFIVVGGVTLATRGSSGLATWLFYGLVLLWGLRLSIHILLRAIGQPEDARYAAWRREHGASWWWQSYLRVFLLQGAVMWVVALPLMFGLAQHREELGAFQIAGAVLFVMGFFFEAIADAQLASFKRNPDNKGKVLDHGLWAWTRHPNYFGETLLWWGFGFYALSVAPFWTLISPLLMTFLLVRISGVVMLDKLLAETKPGYASYMKRTSGFIPLPPRKIKENS